MEKEFELISVIVPIYNVESYLEKCINSILMQSYKNIEIILVDDGSSDNSHIICDEFLKKDNRIKVIHKNNGGLSSARNKGLDIANGNYIAFVDSDDYIEKDMIKELYNNIKKFNSEISICDFFRVNKKRMMHKYEEKELVVKGKDKFKCLEKTYKGISTYSWNKLYKKEIFNNLRFEESKLFEDMFIIHKMLYKANKVSYIIKPLYNYVYRKDSISNNFNEKHYDKIEACNNRIKFYKKMNYSDLELLIKNTKIYYLIDIISKIRVFTPNNIKLKEKCLEELINTSKELSYKEANNITKYYKFFKSIYLNYRYIKTKIKSYIKKNNY